MYTVDGNSTIRHNAVAGDSTNLVLSTLILQCIEIQLNFITDYSSYLVIHNEALYTVDGDVT